jgi:hypothetical protein
MAKRQCAAGTQASLCLPQWTVLKVSLARLGCSRLGVVKSQGCNWCQLVFFYLEIAISKLICLHYCKTQNSAYLQLQLA